MKLISILKSLLKGGGNYILKVSRPDADVDYLDFQLKLLEHVAQQKPDFIYPKLIKTKQNAAFTTITDDYGQKRHVRMLEWISGRLWSQVNPQLDNLRYSLGEKGGF